MAIIMTPEKLAEKYEPILEKLGYNLEIFTDTSSPTYLLKTRIYVPYDLLFSPDHPRPKYMFDINQSNGKRNCELEWDLDNPYDKHIGFSSKSLFLYIHTQEQVEQWLKDNIVQVRNNDVELLVENFIKCEHCTPENAINIVKEIENIIKEKQYGKGDDKDKENSFSLKNFLDNKLVPFLPSYKKILWTQILSCRMSPLNKEDLYNESFNCEKKFLDIRYFCNKDIDKFKQAAKECLDHLLKWNEYFKETFGGATIICKQIKEQFYLKYGDTEALAFAAIHIGKKSNEKIDKIMGEKRCHELFLLHYNDAEASIDIDKAQQFLDELVQKETDSKNGMIFGFILRSKNDPDDKEAITCKGFCGADMISNGLENALKEAIDHRQFLKNAHKQKKKEEVKKKKIKP